MPTEQITPFLPDQAQSRAHDYFEVVLKDWGTDPADRYPIGGGLAAQFSRAFPFSPKGIVIGPRSTVDRCWLSWNPQLSGFAGVPAVDEVLASALFREITHEQPLQFAQPSGEGQLDVSVTSALGRALLQGLLYVFPNVLVTEGGDGIETLSTQLPAIYFKTDGTEVGLGSVGAVFETPRLHLQFVLKDIPFQATKRFPYQVSGSQGGVDPDEEVVIAQLPTFGRKNIIIEAHYVDPGGMGAVTPVIVRIGALRNINANPASPVRETTEGQKALTVSNVSERFHLCDPAADYITINTTGTGGIYNALFTLTAYD